jgi:uncharacterized protein
MFAPLMVTLFLGMMVLGTAAPAVAAPAYPRAQGRCVDSTGVLGPRLCAKVTAILLRDEARTSDEIAVAVVGDTGDASIEEWSTGLFNAWGVGKKDKNNGVLLVVVMDDHELRLETGRGMATRLSDDEAGDIIETVITPQFAEDAYAAGILGGLDEIRRRLGHTVGKDARLLGLAVTAPNPEAMDPEAVDEDASDAEEQALIDGGAETFSDTGYSEEQGNFGDDGSSAGVLFLFIAGAVVIGLVGVVLGRVRSQRWDAVDSGSGGSSGSEHRTTWSSGSSTSSSSSSSGSSDSSSGSSFGGGSSDGGGSSGSW